MSVLSFLKFPFESVVRNRRRSLFAIAGIVIALSLISGSWIAVDSSGMGMLRSRLDRITADFTARDRASSASGISESYVAEKIQAMEAVDYVTDATAFVYHTGAYYQNSDGDTYKGDWGENFTGTLMFSSQDYGPFFSSFHITGDLPDPGTVAVPAYVASMLNLSVGDDITCRYERWNAIYDEWGNYTGSVVEYLNLSFAVSKIWRQDKTDFEDYFYWSYYQHQDDDRWISINEISNPIVFRLSDMQLVSNSALLFDPYWSPSCRYMIWADRNALVDLADLSGSLAKVEQLETKLNRVGMMYGFMIENDFLVGPLEEIGSKMAGIKPLFAALSLPVVALGVYLSVVGVDLGVGERKREIAILKSRGASNRQVFSSLILESLVLGALAGIAGLAFGLLVSRFLLNVATAFTYQEGGGSIATDFSITGMTVFWCVLFGVVLMVLSAYRPFKKVSKTDVKEALHYFSPSVAQIDYKPRTDIILLSLSIISIFSVWVGLDWVSEMDNVSWITRLIVTIIVLVGIVIFPLMPFLLSLSVIRLLTRGSKKLYAKLTFIVKPWTKEVHYLVDKNIVRNPRRASNLCVIIALSLAFGLFISVTMESTMHYEEEVVKFTVGSDVKTDAYMSWQVQKDEFDPDNLETISSLDGVASCARYENVRVSYGYYYYQYYYGNAAVFDALQYKETVRPSGFYFVDGGSEMLDDLAAFNGTVLLAESMAEVEGFEVGDPIPLIVDFTDYFSSNPSTRQQYVTGMVAGIVKGLPGLQDFSIFMDRSSLSFIPAQNYSEIVNGYGVFVDVSKGHVQSDVADEVERIFTDSGLTPSSTTVDSEIEALHGEVTYQALTEFLYMEYVLSVVIMTLGVGILIFVAVNDREKELASIMARGSSGGQIRKLLMGESFTLMILGLIVGASVGLLTAFLFQTLYTGGVSSTIVPRNMLFTWVSGAIVVASVVALILASLLATSRAGKIKLSEVLRIRGG